MPQAHGGEHMLNNNDSQSQRSLAKWKILKNMTNSFLALYSYTKLASKYNVPASKMKIVFSRKPFIEELPSQYRKFGDYKLTP